VDIVGACIGLELLGVKEIYRSPLNVGRSRGLRAWDDAGASSCDAECWGHRFIQTKSPANGDANGRSHCFTLAEGSADARFQDSCDWFRAGSKDFKVQPTLRALQCDFVDPARLEASAAPADRVAVLEACIDDMNPQICGHLLDKLLSSGALDVFTSPVQMKKNRPGLLLTVLAPMNLADTLTAQIFEETTTIGIRYHETERRVLECEIEVLECEFGSIKVKVSKLNGRMINFAPEYEDCRQAALARGIPYKWVQSRVVQLFMNRHSEQIFKSLPSAN
jgi:uncharacterized protein (DUF111 family)